MSREFDEHDQVMPTPNGRADVQSAVVVDMQKRRAVGIERYGTPLQAFNGREAVRDAYEESLDLVVYLRQAMEENQAIRRFLSELYVDLIEGRFRDDPDEATRKLDILRRIAHGEALDWGEV